MSNSVGQPRGGGGGVYRGPSEPRPRMTDCLAEGRAMETATQKVFEAQSALAKSLDQIKLHPLREQYSRDMEKLTELEKEIKQLKAIMRTNEHEIDKLIRTVKPLNDAIKQAKKDLDRATKKLEKCKEREA